MDVPQKTESRRDDTQPDPRPDEDSRRPALFLWFDAEFTSLDFESAALLQVAAVATDVRLNRVFPPEEDVCLCVRLDPKTPVSPWSTQHLAALIERCRSAEAVPVEEADRRLAAYGTRAAQASGAESDSPPILAGNSVHADWAIARRLLPAFSRTLHYRHLDVTSFKLLWLAAGKTAFAKENPDVVRAWFATARLEGGAQHDAYFDVQASIAEMAFYRARLMRHSALLHGLCHKR